jgi:hypothetical protein
MSDEVIKVLCQRVIALQQQQDELAWNEIALIATLTKLLPGFAQEFARQCITVKRLASPRNAAELVMFIEALKVTVKSRDVETRDIWLKSQTLTDLIISSVAGMDIEAITEDPTGR